MSESFIVAITMMYSYVTTVIKIKIWSMSSFNSFQNTLFWNCIFILKAVYLLVHFFFSLCVSLYNFMRETRASANNTSQSQPTNLHRQAMVCDRRNNAWRVQWSFIQLPAHTWINPFLFGTAFFFICIRLCCFDSNRNLTEACFKNVIWSIILYIIYKKIRYIKS